MTAPVLHLLEDAGDIQPPPKTHLKIVWTVIAKIIVINMISEFSKSRQSKKIAHYLGGS